MDLLVGPYTEWYIALHPDNDVVMGYIAIIGTHIALLEVYPPYRYQGVGRSLVQYVVDHLTESKMGQYITLEPLPSSEGFWRKMKFRPYDEAGISYRRWIDPIRKRAYKKLTESKKRKL